MLVGRPGGLVNVLVRAIEPAFDGPDGDLGPALEAEPPQDVLDVVGDRALAEDQPLGDRGV